MVITILAGIVWVLIFAIYALVLLGEYTEQTDDGKCEVSFWEFVWDAWLHVGAGVLLLVDLIVSAIYWNIMLGLMPVVSVALLVLISWCVKKAGVYIVSRIGLAFLMLLGIDPPEAK